MTVTSLFPELGSGIQIQLPLYINLFLHMMLMFLIDCSLQQSSKLIS